jgi:hypothetical protein
LAREFLAQALYVHAGAGDIPKLLATKRAARERSPVHLPRHGQEA